MDPILYERYSVPLEAKMFELEAVVEDLSHTLDATRVAADPLLVEDLTDLLRLLSGNPGDGALEVYRDLERDLSSTRSFIARWAAKDSGKIAPLVVAARRVDHGLQQLQDLVRATPPEVMEEIKRRLVRNRGLASSSARLLRIGAVFEAGFIAAAASAATCLVLEEQLSSRVLSHGFLAGVGAGAIGLQLAFWRGVYSRGTGEGSAWFGFFLVVLAGVVVAAVS
jgi:hypothetical protein